MGDGGATLDCVKLDGLVVLKIVKHCKESLPALVTGQLLGLAFQRDDASTLEVTNCFPFPSRSEDVEGNVEDDGADYRIAMMRCLREVNVDNNTVGWYQSTYLGSFLNETMIETQFNYQDHIKNGVCIVYDPLKTPGLVVVEGNQADAFVHGHVPRRQLLGGPAGQGRADVVRHLPGGADPAAQHGAHPRAAVRLRLDDEAEHRLRPAQ